MLDTRPRSDTRPYAPSVSKQHKTKTFAEIVREVEEHPADPVPDRSGVVDPSGRRWHQELAQISPERALELAQQGAAVAWDFCGCRGYCGLEWYSADEVAALVESGKPTIKAKKRSWGNISQWATSEGEVLVVAEVSVQWGSLILG